MSQASSFKEVAIITPNARNGWSLLLPGSGRQIGNYSDPEKASQIAILNGYEPEIHEKFRHNER